MPRDKLTGSEKKILRELIFPETFDHIISETELSYGEIRNDLIQLMNHGYIKVCQSDSNQSGIYFDSDNVQLFSFKATKTGLKKIQNDTV